MPTYNRANADSGDVTTNKTGVLSEIWKKSIPQNHTISTNVGASTPPLFRLYTEDVFSGNNSKTTFSLNDSVVDNPRLSSTDGDVVAYVDGSKTEAFSVDYANNEVTFDSAPSSGSDNVEVFYLFDDGRIELQVENNDQGDRTDSIVEEPIRALHLVDQLDNPVSIDEAHMRKPNNLVLKLSSSVEITTDDRAPHKIRIPYRSGVATEEQVEAYQDDMGNSV